MKLRRIWKVHGRLSTESRTDDKKRSKCLIETRKAICMEFKAKERKGLREVAKLHKEGYSYGIQGRGTQGPARS
jgi:hypothetical protein